METKDGTSEVTFAAFLQNVGNDIGGKSINEAPVIVGDASEGSSSANVIEAGVSARPCATNGVYGSSSSVRVKPPPPFLLKVYDMVQNPEMESIISWNDTGTSFIVWDPHRLAAEVLNKYFRHNNLTSFICQLNTYCFRKISWDRLEFQNEWFQKGKKRWLKNIKRRNQNIEILQQSGATEPAGELQREFEFLRHEHDALNEEMKKIKEGQEDAMEEMVNLKKQALSSTSKLQKIMKFATETVLMQKNELCSTGIAKKQRLEGRQSTESLVELEDIGETFKRIQGNLPSTETDKNDELLVVDSCTPVPEKEKNKVCEASFPDFGSSDFLLLEKQLMEEMNFENVPKEEMAKLQSSIVIELEDLIAGPSDWVEYTKDLMDKARSLKSNPSF